VGQVICERDRPSTPWRPELGHYVVMLDYALAATGCVLDALPGRRAPVGTQSEHCAADSYGADTHHQQDNPNGIYVETSGGNCNGIFEDGTDNDQHDPEADQTGPSSPRHFSSFHSVGPYLARNLLCKST
jgi:hypothetical protein